jgi:Uma2 family endonuclease
MVARAAPRATAATLAALGDAAAEIIHGAVVYKAEPSAEHGDAQLGLGEIIRGRFHGPPGGPRGPGGWWIVTEVEVELEDHEVYRPDLVGWRRDTMPERPRGRPIRVRPDWVCEVLSTSNAATDLVTKLAVYHRNGVPHYWIVDPATETLTVHRFTADGYLIALRAARPEVVRAEPFDAIELHVGSLFGDE